MVNLVEITKSCAKGLLIVLNVLCILIALTSFAFALVDIKVLKRYGEEQSGGCFAGDVVIIVASLVLVGIATLGLVGAIKERVKILYLYVGFVLIMIILELLIAIYVSVLRYDLQLRITEWIREDFYRNVTASELEHHLKTWDRLQTTYECCGLNHPEDYIALGQHIPVSCCARAYGAKSENTRQLIYKSCVELKTYYEDGCEEEILYMLQSDSDYLIGVAVISFWFEASGILLAMWVSKHLRNSVQVYKNTVRY